VVKPYTADVYDTLFRGNTGGISHISVREATANNPECPNYNPELPTTWLVPWDMAALYGDTMRDHLPSADLEFIDESERPSRESIMNTDWNESDTGYIMVGNLSYPREHHKKFRDYPPAPYKRPIQWEELPPHVRKSQRNKAQFEAGQMCPYHTGGTEGKDGTYQCTCRLITDLKPHQATLHVRLLKHYLELGCEFEIQKVIRFGQSEVLRSYIDLNDSHRRPAISRINELTEYLSTRSSAKERVKLTEEKEKRCRPRRKQHSTKLRL